MIRHCRVVAITLAILAAVVNAHAWTDEGHQTVGAIGDSLISGHAAQKHVQQLLGTETLSVASTWADQVKGWGEQTDEMEQFRNDNPHHGQYHYTD
ncbi:MAG: phospholipase, partial [Verrucomicrobiales bacterium]|nr:phospholipase [Verrucomicrobiales bacterium]